MKHTHAGVPVPARRHSVARPARGARAVARRVARAAACGCASTGMDYKIVSMYAVDDPQFQRTMGTLLGPPIIPGNSVTTLRNGDEIFPAMLGAIAGAQSTITFETFVYWSGTTGRTFADALCERARAGVHVPVLIDPLGGSRIDSTYFQ